MMQATQAVLLGNATLHRASDETLSEESLRFVGTILWNNYVLAVICTNKSVDIIAE
jgi:hypothetical protein